MTYQRYVTWAREQRRARKLPGPHGDALQTTATFANAEGECGASAALIGEIIGYCRQEAQGLLSDLTRMGLLHPPERRGRMTFRRLRLDAPSPDQLQIDAPEPPPVARLTVGPRRRQRNDLSLSASEVSGVGLNGVQCRVPGGDTKSEVTEEEPPTPCRTNRQRDRATYDVALRDWSLRVMPGAGEEELGAIREAMAMVRYRERVGNPDAPPVSRREVLAYIRRHRPDITVPTIEEEGPR